MFQLKVVFELGSVRLCSLKQTSWSGLFVPSLVQKCPQPYVHGRDEKVPSEEMAVFLREYAEKKKLPRILFSETH